MKKHFIIFLIFCSPLLLFAQNTFLKVYGAHDHEIGNIGLANSTGHLIGGYSLSYSNVQPIGTLIKTDLQGQQLWSKTYATTFGSILTYGLAESNGDYLISGQSNTNSNFSDGLILKINGQGAVQWARKTGAATGGDKMLRLIKSSDGNYLAGGMIESQTAGGARDMVLTKINPNDGTPIWSRVWGGGQNDWVTNFIENSSGFLVGGNTFSYGSGQHDFTVTQLDNNGTILWSKVYGTSNEEQMWNINRVNNTLNVVSGFQTISGTRRLFIIGIDNNGNQIWNKTYSIFGKSIAGRTFVASNGDVLLAAYEPTNSSDGNIHLLRINSATGNLIWAREYLHQGFEVANVLEEKNNGNIVVYGYSSSFGAGQRDFLLMEVTSTGMLADCGVSTVTSSILTNNLTINTQNINPFSSTTLNNISTTINSYDVTTTAETICNNNEVNANFSMSDTSICVGECISLTNLSTNTTQWQWSFTGGNPTSSNAQNVNQVCYSTAGTYTIQLIASDASVSDTIIQTITVNDLPIVNLGTDTSICNHQAFLLDAFFPNASYQWNTGATSSDLPVTSSSSYAVTVTLGDCSVSDTIQVTVENNDCGCYPFIPNAFSPNNNGQNDLFKVYTKCPLENFELMIFDRWGHLFFKSNDINTGWDGTFRGKAVQNGVYIWMVQYRAAGENGLIEERLDTGDVTLIR